MDTQSELEEVKINTFINDMNDTKQAVVNLLDTLKKINLALAVIGDNQITKLEPTRYSTDNFETFILHLFKRPCRFFSFVK